MVDVLKSLEEITTGYNVIGTRWDSTHADNMINLEKNLVE